jgi:hypothetical protein
VRADALVVGGSIHVRLERRRSLQAEGYRVTIEGSTLRGLSRLRKHPYALCALDLTEVPRAKEWKRKYGSATRSCGTELRDETAY